MAKHIVYGLIPARSGSKGVPSKNLRRLCGKPLIAYMINSAVSAKAIDEIYVSTDSEEIAEVARKYKAKAVLHPAELSTDTAPTFGVVQYINQLFQSTETPPDIVVTMRATSPLCLSTDIDEAIKLLFRRSDATSVISVTKSPVHPFRTLLLNRFGEIEHFDKRTTEKDFPQQRQTFSDVYVRNGAIYATRSRVIEEGSLWGKHSLPFIMPKERSVNINDEVDFLLAETLMELEKKRPRRSLNL